MNIIAWIFWSFYRKLHSLVSYIPLGDKIKCQKNIMKIHNLLKNPGDFPPVAEGEFNLHHQSNDVNLVYRSLLQNSDGSWEIVLGYGRGFYVHDENLWYGYYDDHKAQISNLFSETAGQERMFKEELIEEGCPKELVDQLTPVPEGWAYQDWEEGLVFVVEIVGWYELPTYQEFISEG